MIELEHVSRKFGNFCAVDDISFSIKTGEIIGLLGPNGAGKTTTMRMISGFLEPSSGSIKIDGFDVIENPVECKKQIGYMPESAPLYSDMIVADYLEYVANLEGKNPAEKLPLLAEVCGLKEVMHKNISELSRGNKQRVGLAHALMNDPEILILDEPTSGLDPNQVSEVRALIKKIGETRTVIISTHILSEVEMLCSRVIIISNGKKVADSPTETLREQFGSNVKIEMELGKELEKSKISSVLSGISGASGVFVEEKEDKFFASVSCAQNVEIRPALAKAVLENSVSLYSLSLKKNSLEDVFHSLTNGGDEK